MSHATSPVSRLVEQILEQQAQCQTLIESLQGPERSAMRFMCEAYRAIDTVTGLTEAFSHEAFLASIETYRSNLRSLLTSRMTAAPVDPHIYLLLQALPSTAPELLARDYDVSLKVVADWLDTSTKTIARRGKVALLSRTESDVALRYGRVFEQAREAFGTEEAARQWLTQAQPALGGAVPVELLRSELGARQVERVLELIDYGDYL